VTLPSDPSSGVVSAAAAPSAPPAPGAAPRTLTPLALRRAWTEPTVRMWWLLAATILLMTLIFAADRAWAWHTQSKLIRDGLLVDAKVTEVNGQAITNLKQPPDSQTTLDFDWQGKPQRVRGQLDDRTDYIVVGQTVPIHVDPNDPQNWTARTQPPPLAQSLFVGFIMLPVALVLLPIAAMKRKRLLQTWQSGHAELAVVIERQQTPLAPLSHAIRCGLRDRRDKRVFTVFVPRGGTTLQKNDLLWIVMPNAKSAKPVAARWFE